ncbi:MAG: glycerol-3-phosphate 1-O-acyltransferase PlsY [Oscillospiraceae bacterium]
MINILIASLMSALLAYLLGSINFAIIISKLCYRKDIRTFGSGNAGMTNVLRTFGKGAAAATLIGDIAKGTVGVLFGRTIFILISADSNPLYGAYIAAIFAVLGHLFPVYFKFKGGKGVSVATGALLAIEPTLIIALVVIFLIVFLCSKMVSLASVICAISYPLLTFVLNIYRNTEVLIPTIFAFVIALIVIYMHRANIKRIITGTEYKFGTKK